MGLGDDISFDFSFNPGADGSPASVDGLTALIKITNVGTGDVANFNPLFTNAGFMGMFSNDNAHSVDAPGGFQNSERLSFGIFNGNPFLNFGDINFDSSVNNTYLIDFSVSGSNFATISDSIVVNQGAGAALGAVPEPASWALMIMGFGLAGAALRRRRTVAAL